MKIIMTILMSALITYNINAQEQEKKEPTKKETFDFIVKMMSKQDKIVVLDYDDDSTIINNEWDNYSRSKIKMDDLLKVEEVKYVNAYNYYSLQVYFKTGIERRIKDRNGNWRIAPDKFNNIDFSFKEMSDAKKMRKALLHYIKLNGGSDSFFED